MAIADESTTACGVKMKDLHPTPWRVRPYVFDHANEVCRVWNGHDKRADGFEVYDAAGVVVRAGFADRRSALGWALVNVAA